MGDLSKDLLFLGLTRPSMLFGVTYSYVGLNIIISIAAFLTTENFAALLVLAPTVHLVFYLICLNDPLSFEVLIKKNSTCSLCPNKSLHGFTNSYDVI